MYYMLMTEGEPTGNDDAPTVEETQPGRNGFTGIELDMDERTSITAYEPELKIMKRAKRKMERELDEDIALHTALVMMSEMYLNTESGNDPVPPTSDERDE